MEWQSLDWWDLWDWQKVVVANPTEQIDKMLGLLGYESYAIEQRFVEQVGDIWEGRKTNRPSDTVTYWWTPSVNSEEGSAIPISFDILIGAIGALAPDAWVMVAREHSAPVTDIYMREEATYSPSKGMRFDATYYDSYDERFGDYDEERDGNPPDADERRRAQEYAPILDDQAMAELIGAIGAEEWGRLVEEASKAGLAQQDDLEDADASLGQTYDPVFRSLEGDPLPFLFKYDESKGRLFVAACYSDEKEVVVPEEVADKDMVLSVGGISEGCFSRNKNLESIVLPSSIKLIEAGAFKGIESRLKSIRFKGCPEGENMFISHGSALTCAISPKEELVIPKSIERISRYALSGCWRLRTLVLHDKVKLPTERALASAPNLKCVVLADGSKVDISEWGAFLCSAAVQDDFMERLLISNLERQGFEF